LLLHKISERTFLKVKRIEHVRSKVKERVAAEQVSLLSNLLLMLHGMKERVAAEQVSLFSMLHGMKLSK
jgi:hypothetical protein